jgi:hypothetical protein
VQKKFIATIVAKDGNDIGIEEWARPARSASFLALSAVAETLSVQLTAFLSNYSPKQAILMSNSGKLAA